MPAKIKVNFLGTSAQIPTAKRNHSGILINYNSENILVDCGEGMQRQFRVAKLNPCKLTRILITHIHADHVLGLPGLLSTLAFSEYNKTLFIYGPSGFGNFMKKFLDLFHLDKKIKLKIKEVSGKFLEEENFYLEAEKMEHGISTNAYNFVIKDKFRIDKNKLKKLKVPEGKHLASLSIGKDIIYQRKKYKAKDIIYLEKGKKISFVLDTLVNPRIENFVKGADLFVSEASFSSEDTDKAKDHLHLTSEQAAKIAKKAKIGKLILTHLGGRYEKNPKKILNEARSIFDNTILAKDFDVIEV